MPTREANTWKISKKMEPNWDGGLLQNDFVQGTMFVRFTRAQRNAIGKLYRKFDTATTTLCLVINDGTIYKLINEPGTETTTDLDWSTAISVADAGTDIIPIGEWDASNTDPVLQDTDANGINGNFYYVKGAPNETDVTYAGLFQGNTVQVINNDWVISVGTHFIVIRNTTQWENLNRPQAIIDYENGIVIAHTHDIGDILNLSSELALKYDQSDLANMVLDFVDVPDSEIGHVAFLRKHFYDKENTYSRVEVDALISLISSEDPSFDGLRAVRKIPSVGEVTGTSKVGTTLDELFYGFIKPEHSLELFPVREVGASVQPVANGLLDPKDAEAFVGNIIIYDEDDAIAGQLAPSAPPATTVIAETLVAKTIEWGEAQNYRLAYVYQKETGGSNVNAQSDRVYLKGVYPFLTGMAATGLTGATIYSGLSKTVADKGTRTFSFTGSNQRTYIAYPVTYGELKAIEDESGNNLIGSLFPSSPVTLSVDSSGLTVDWTTDYYVYESQYNVSLTAAKFVAYFDVIENLTDLNLNLDSIPEGTTNKHFTSSLRDKLTGITINPADIGDMKKSEFVTNYEGIVDYSVNTAIVGYNESGSPIAAGSYVKLTGWNDTEGLATFATADKDNNDAVAGFTTAVIADSSSGIIIIRGGNRLINTTGQTPGTPVYLGTNGGVLFSPPVSGSLVQVGVVVRVANPGIVATRNITNLIADEVHVNFRPNTKYGDFSTCIYDDPQQGLVLLRAKAAFTSSGTIDLNDWDVVGSDMKRDIYDTDNNGIIDEATGTVIEVYNATGSTISKGKLVKFSGFNAIVGKPTIVEADQSNGDEAVAMVVNDITTVSEGKVFVRGIIKGVNTLTLTVGDRLYLSTTGDYTITKPTSGYIQEIGRVTRVGDTDGEILIYLNEKQVENIENNIAASFTITGGNVVQTVLGYDCINELTQDVDYTLPLISGLATTKLKIFVKNGSGQTINLLTNNPDTIEGDSTVEMLNGESFTFYINNGYKIL